MISETTRCEWAFPNSLSMYPVWFRFYLLKIDLHPFSSLPLEPSVIQISHIMPYLLSPSSWNRESNNLHSEPRLLSSSVNEIYDFKTAYLESHFDFHSHSHAATDKNFYWTNWCRSFMGINDGLSSYWVWNIIRCRRKANGSRVDMRAWNHWKEIYAFVVYQVEQVLMGKEAEGMFQIRKVAFQKLRKIRWTVIILLADHVYIDSCYKSWLRPKKQSEVAKTCESLSMFDALPVLQIP